MNQAPSNSSKRICDRLPKSQNGSRSVVASNSKFAFPTLSVDCICLYVDADNIGDLAISVASSNTITIIVNANLYALAGREVARELVEPPGLDKVELSERKWQLRKNIPQRSIRTVGPFKHGQSVSLFAAESKGSVSVFLTPDSPPINPVHGLAAYHVLPFKEAKEARVITPGGLDILTRLLNNKLSDNEVSFLMSRWSEKCGEAKFGHIGTNSRGWRTDFALFEMGEEFWGANGLWFDDEMFLATEKRNPDYTGESGIVEGVDAKPGVICYTDGASSGCTAGR